MLHIQNKSWDVHCKVEHQPTTNSILYDHIGKYGILHRRLVLCHNMASQCLEINDNDRSAKKSSKCHFLSQISIYFFCKENCSSRDVLTRSQRDFAKSHARIDIWMHMLYWNDLVSKLITLNKHFQGSKSQSNRWV